MCRPTAMTFNGDSTATDLARGDDPTVRPNSNHDYLSVNEEAMTIGGNHERHAWTVSMPFAPRHRRPEAGSGLRRPLET
jgi:hypothetical protein